MKKKVWNFTWWSNGKIFFANILDIILSNFSDQRGIVFYFYFWPSLEQWATVHCGMVQYILALWRNGWKKLGGGGGLTQQWGLWRCIVSNHLGVIQCTCLKMPCESKTLGRRAQETEIWDAWALVVLAIWGRVDLLIFSHFGSSSAFTWHQGTSAQIYKCYCCRQAKWKGPWTSCYTLSKGSTVCRPVGNKQKSGV